MATQRNGLPPSLSLHPALEQAELDKCWTLCPGCALALFAPPCNVPTFITRYILNSSSVISLLRPDSVPSGRACRVPISIALGTAQLLSPTLHMPPALKALLHFTLTTGGCGSLCIIHKMEHFQTGFVSSSLHSLCLYQ